MSSALRTTQVLYREHLLCWRWWEDSNPLHEWSHVAVSYDGTNEAHFISRQVEAAACGAGGATPNSQADALNETAGRNLGHSSSSATLMRPWFLAERREGAPRGL